MPAADTLRPPDDETRLPIGRLDVTVDEKDRALGVALYREHLRNIVPSPPRHEAYPCCSPRSPRTAETHGQCDSRRARAGRKRRASCPRRTCAVRR